MNINNVTERELRIHERASDSSGSAHKLLRLKRSLTFMRSKSVENFFQRCQSDDVSSDVTHSPDDVTDTAHISISTNTTTSPAPSVTQPRPPLKHIFLEHVFRRPTSCHLCKNIIVGNSKQGLRCKTCKMGVHLWCVSELSQQACQGKSGMFKRNLSSPLLTDSGLCVVKSQDAQVDPVYTTLRFGSSLARSSFCESPTQSLDEEEELQMNECSSVDGENVTEKDFPVSEKQDVDETSKVPKVHSLYTYVVLYKFLPQEQNDLELHPGDRVQVIDDSNEEWWKGKCGEKVGFFPANFVQRVRPGERVWKVTQGVNGNRDLGHMTVKEAQICVGKSEDTDGFLKLSSGKKKGLVPADSLEEI